MSDEPTKEELYTEAQALEIEGRSTMGKEALAEAVAAAQPEPVAEPEPEPEPEVEVAVEPEVEVAVEPEPEPEPVEREEGPVIALGPTTQGGLTFLTDRSQ